MASSANAGTKGFPPTELRQIVNEVTGLLKERKETISVAETVCLSSLTFQFVVGRRVLS